MDVLVVWPICIECSEIYDEKEVLGLQLWLQSRMDKTFFNPYLNEGCMLELVKEKSF